ncbi:MAG TPA: DNA gyrase/topoisomerase IV subunit A [Chitinophagaceae bacterium]|nr:DNA gyrase/topoisomerase IV subunit A [Chitinophagaceae bacterium]
MAEEFDHEAKSVNKNHVNEMYQNWFLDYASYVILERAVPAGLDGLKPVQRRILHALKEMDDGRFNKVANVIGQTMQYHPHGDASIADAIVNIGQKDLMLDTQGNWGDFRTGDNAAAPRYIETRLSKFALDVAFNAKITDWQLSYDGRKNEPVTLPMKFPLLLAQGAEGIAVGLSTKILPHNFCELIDASIKYLKGKKFELYPDFLTEGMADITNYNDGKRGGKVRVRVHIEKVDNKSLLIKDVPFGITVPSLIESIVKANDNGKIKIKKVTDATAANVEIEVQLAAGVTPDQTIDALYAFTNCEVSISPNICVIVDDKPRFISATELLKISVDETKDLLRKELELKLRELDDNWHYSSLEKIFIEKRIYRDIEEEETWEGVIAAIDKGLKPYKKLFRREITVEDITRLTEIKIKRISKFDSFKADEHIKAVEKSIEETKHHLEHLVDFTISYFEDLLKKYGKGRERKTELKIFDTIQVSEIAIANTKLYINREEGFIGTSLKKDEFLVDCADVDQIIAFTKEGKMKVIKVADKVFIGKEIIHAEIFKKADERTTYNMIYVDGKTGIAYAKRFNVTGITRDKEYDLTKGSPKSKSLYFTSNPNGESELVGITLSAGCKAKIKSFEFDFAELAIKGRSSMGNQVTKYPIKGIKLKMKGSSSLGGKKLWYDDVVGRLNTDEKGMYLGSFAEEDKILTMYNDGTYTLNNTELSNRFDAEKVVMIEKFKPQAILSAVYFDADKKQFNAKRFKIETLTLNTKFQFIKEGEGNYLEWITSNGAPIIKLKTGKKKYLPSEQIINLEEFVDVMGWKAIGTKLCEKDLLEISLLNEENEDDNKQGELF